MLSLPSEEGQSSPTTGFGESSLPDSDPDGNLLGSPFEGHPLAGCEGHSLLGGGDHSLVGGDVLGDSSFFGCVGQVGLEGHFGGGSVLTSEKQ